MNQRTRIALFATVAVVTVGGVSAYAVTSAADYQQRHHRSPTVPVVPDPPDPHAPHHVATGPRIVFRHTGIDDHIGLVASVPLDDPGGPRTFTQVACDRVDATEDRASCLRIERGVVTTYSLTEYDADWRPVEEVSLPGIPSRTRLSPDGRLVASTTFVSGHSYMQVGFSTATEIRDFGGGSHGNLEKFDLVIDGDHVAPRDRNVWGVTFVDDTTFYATVGTGGETYLVRGDLAARTLTSVADHVECPSLSPDGTRIGFKQATRRDGQTWWTPAVLDLSTGERTVLAGETRNVDDQVEWLDEDTLLYGLARDDQPGVTDVWELDTRADAEPRLLIEQAWSPAVVR
ncbi:hypothetical protein [Nocardioides conyzicola]|uniref:PD40 domain-containing protein n=1 Tax=Nocardioides conyzicola TaxID=1651781 RepID=A0ABP8XLP6_9ACTN